MSRYILEKIINQVERSANDWREGRDGNRSFKVQQPDYDSFGKTELIEEARELEQRGLIRAEWFCGGSEIGKITYRLKDLPVIYGIVGKGP